LSITTRRERGVFNRNFGEFQPKLTLARGTLRVVTQSGI